MGTGREGEGDIREGGGGLCINKKAIGIPPVLEMENKFLFRQRLNRSSSAFLRPYNMTRAIVFFLCEGDVCAKHVHSNLMFTDIKIVIKSNS